MASRQASRYRHSAISLGEPGGDGIQLNERQKQLLEMRRKAKELGSQIPTTKPVTQPDPPSHQDVPLKGARIEKTGKVVQIETTSRQQVEDDEYHGWSLADNPTTTAPTTSWGSSSAASSESSFTNPAQEFYGQGLTGQAKKLYDDTGMSYHESRSEASASSAAASAASSRISAAKAPLSQASSTQKGEKELGLAPVKEEKEKPEEKPKSRLQLPPSNRRLSKFGANRSKASVSSASDDQQKAFLRKMMQSYTNRKANQGDDSASEASSKGNAKNRRLSWTNRKSKVLVPARSGSSSSSALHPDKAIMKKVLERAKTKKLASNPRKQNFVKQSSTRMKQLLSPKRSTSDDSGNDEKSFTETDRRNERRRSFTRFTSRKTKSPRPHNMGKNASRWSNHASDKEARADGKAEPRTFDKELKTSFSNSTAEETASVSTKETEAPISTGKPTTQLQPEDQSVASTQSARSGLSSVDSRASTAATDIKQTIGVSGLTQKKSCEAIGEDESSNRMEAQASKEEEIVRGAPDMRHSIQSIPDITKQDEIEIKLSVSSLSQRFETNQKQASSMPVLKTSASSLSQRDDMLQKASTGIVSVMTTDTTPLHSNNINVDRKTLVETASDTSSATVPEGYGDFMKAARKEFMSYEEKARETNKDILELIYSEEPDGYAEFVETLKAEISGSHSKLWNSFRSLFRGDDGSAGPPLQASCTNCTFDDKTKDMVTNMSSYLKTNYNVDCDTGTQLANDRLVQGGAVMKKSTFSREMLRHISQKNDGASFGSYSQNAAMIVQVPSSDSINDNQMNDEFEVTLTQHARKSMGEQRSKPVVCSTAPTSQQSSGITAAPSNHSNDSTLNSISLSVASKKRRIHPVDPPSSEVSIPWSGVQLRSVMDSKSESSSDSIPTSWAKVKLRPVQVKDDKSNSSENLKSIDNDESEGIHHFVVRKPSIEKKNSETESDCSNLNDEHHSESSERKDKPTQLPSTDTKEIQLVVNESENCTASTSDSMDSTEGSVVVSLCPEPGHPHPDRLKVVVGKKGLMKVETTPGETKARVIWRLDLDDLKSAMLDMSACKVKLLLNNNREHKDLSFFSSEHCMRFANVLHEVTNAMGDEGSDSTESAEDSVYVEQLSEEEQRVLEEFRQKKHQTLGPEDLAKQSLTIKPENPSKPLSVVDANGLSSPLSEISGTSSTLSSEESQVAESYQKMLRLKIPKDAVRHKMEQDQVDPKIMGFVLGEETLEVARCASSTTSGLSVKEQKIASRFEKMLKMMIPPEAVRHEMEKNNVDQKIVFAVLGEDRVEQNHIEHAANKLSGAEQKLAESYQKMLKMMIPKEAVEHKMKQDQVDPKIIMVVVGGNPDKAPHAKAPKSKLSDAEESLASSYRQMLKLKVPKEAVRQKMEAEGISEKVIVSVLGEKFRKAPATHATTPRKGITSTKPGFHWSPLPSGEEIQNSIWAIKKPLIESEQASDIDISKHIEQFQKKQDAPQGSKKKAKSGVETKEMAKLIDFNRANNVAVTLKAFKEFSQVELSQIIEFIDPFEKINGDRALFMKDLLPAAAEVKVIKSYKGKDDKLIPAERWFKKIIHIKRIEEKIHVMRTMEAFKNEAAGMEDAFRLLTNACNQVMSSEKLPYALEMVRQIGNRMNEGRGEEAAGFKMDFLPRLAQTKGSDKKTTAFDLVVMISAARNQREALSLQGEFPDCREASRIQISELSAEVRKLGGAMRKCRKEMEALKTEAGSGKPPRFQVKIEGDSKSESALDKPVAHKNFRSNQTEVKTDVSSMHRELFAKRSNFINSVLKGINPGNQEYGDGGDDEQGETTKVGEILKTFQTSKSEEENSISPRASLRASQISKDGLEESDEVTYNLGGSIKRIEKFLKEANEVFSKLEAERDQAIAACKELSEFFCERGGEQAISNLLSILAEFADNLDRAVKKHDQKEKLESRKKKAEMRKEHKEQKLSKIQEDKVAGPVRTEFETEKKSLVTMVNEMLKMAGDKFKNDFASGITYEDTEDERLQQVYEREKEREEPKTESPRRNIRLAIEARRKLHGDKEVEEGLSELARAMEKRAQLERQGELTKDYSNEDAGSEIQPASSLSYSEDSSQRTRLKTGSGSFDDDSLASTSKSSVSAPARGRRSSIAERWTRKIEDDDVSGTMRLNVEKADFEILAADSHDSEDRKVEEKRRQQYISRWTANDAVVEAKSIDLEEESDAGASFQFMNRTRQRYMNRWASKPNESEEEPASDLVE